MVGEREVGHLDIAKRGYRHASPHGDARDEICIEEGINIGTKPDRSGKVHSAVFICVDATTKRLGISKLHKSDVRCQSLSADEGNRIVPLAGKASHYADRQILNIEYRATRCAADHDLLRLCERAALTGVTILLTNDVDGVSPDGLASQHGTFRVDTRPEPDERI